MFNECIYIFVYIMYLIVCRTVFLLCLYISAVQASIQAYQCSFVVKNAGV